jgi:phosphoribosylanthranilate isomerase
MIFGSIAEDASIHTLIKGCRVTTASELRRLAQHGYAFAGIHAVHRLAESDLDNAHRLAGVVAEEGLCVTPVLVTKVADPVAVVRALSYTGIRWVQLHCRWSAVDVIRLRDKCHRGDVQVRIIALLDPADPRSADDALDLAAATDHLILDHSQGGTGQRLPESALGLVQSVPSGSVFLAGGLTGANVGRVIRRYHPLAVDVQSGISDAGGRHDPDKVAAFASAVRAAQK